MTDASLTSAMEEAVEWMILLQSPTPAQCQAFDAWLARDPRHVDAYARASAGWGHPAAAQVAEQMAASLPRRRGARPRRHLPWAAVAAILVLTVASLYKLPLRLQADYVTAIGERQQLSLGDGTQVVLNTETALASDDRQGHRAARLLQGEASFKVPGRALPLEVQAGGLVARANDSMFTVSLLQGLARVQVERGEVELRNGRQPPINLPAGMGVNLAAGGFDHPAPLQPDQDLAWLRGRLVFVDRPLREVLANLSRYYPGWIIDSRTGLDEQRVTGNYSVEDPASVVRALAQVTSARLREFPALMILN